LRRPILVCAGGLLAIGLIAASVSWTPSVVLSIAGEDGAPAADAYVRYYYAGRLLNFVHPVTYVARGSVITRSDATGRVSIPGRWHVRAPFPISTAPELFIAGIYVPRLHNAFGPVARLTQSRPGVFTIDDRRERITVSDATVSIERWEASVRSLSDWVRDVTSPISSTSATAGDRETMAHVTALERHLQMEQAALAARRAPVQAP
jgi:hypothetical protein